MQNTEQELVANIAAYVRFIKRRWLIFFIIGLVGAVIGAAYKMRKPPNYEANLSFALDENAGATGMLSGAMGFAAEQFGLGSTSKNIFSGDNILAILTSRLMVEKTLLATVGRGGSKKTLAEIFGTAEKGEDYRPYLQGRSESTTPNHYLRDSIISHIHKSILKSHLRVGRPDRKLNLYVISFRSSDQQLSKAFVDTLVAVTRNYYTTLRTQKSKNVLTVLEARAASMKSNLSNSVVRQNYIKDANLNSALSQPNSSIQIEEVNKRVYGEAYATLYANLEMARLQYLKDVPLLQIIDEPVYPLERAKRGALKTGLIVGFISVSFALLFFTLLFFYKASKLKRDQV